MAILDVNEPVLPVKPGKLGVRRTSFDLIYRTSVGTQDDLYRKLDGKVMAAVLSPNHAADKRAWVNGVLVPRAVTPPQQQPLTPPQQVPSPPIANLAVPPPLQAHLMAMLDQATAQELLDFIEREFFSSPPPAGHLAPLLETQTLAATGQHVDTSNADSLRAWIQEKMAGSYTAGSHALPADDLTLTEFEWDPVPQAVADLRSDPTHGDAAKSGEAAYTQGQYIVAGNGNKYHWDGATWATGAAP